MSAILYDYPKSAFFGKIVPKNKIYEHCHSTASVKKLFVQQIEQIVWLYKLAPETINIRPTKSVMEIQVFSIKLRDGKIKQEVLRSIDQAVSSPIIFELLFAEQCKVMAAYKRPNEADSSKWVISDYVETAWMNQGAPRSPLPVVLDLGVLYEHLLFPLMPYPPRSNERLPQHFERMGRIRAKQRELDKCRAFLSKEKQFNRKVEINTELRILNQELDGLIG